MDSVALASWVQIAFVLVGAAMSMLLGVVTFFLVRLVRRVDKVDLIEPLTVEIRNVGTRLEQLCETVATLNEVRIEVAAIKAKLNGGSSRRRHGALSES